MATKNGVDVRSPCGALPRRERSYNMAPPSRPEATDE